MDSREYQTPEYSFITDESISYMRWDDAILLEDLVDAIMGHAAQLGQKHEEYSISVSSLVNGYEMAFYFTSSITEYSEMEFKYKMDMLEVMPVLLGGVDKGRIVSSLKNNLASMTGDEVYLYDTGNTLLATSSNQISKIIGCNFLNLEYAEMIIDAYITQDELKANELQQALRKIKSESLYSLRSVAMYALLRYKDQIHTFPDADLESFYRYIQNVYADIDCTEDLGGDIDLNTLSLN